MHVLHRQRGSDQGSPGGPSRDSLSRTEPCTVCRVFRVAIERKGGSMEKSRINGTTMGHQASRLVTDARELAQTSVDEGKAFISRKAFPFMAGSFIAGLCLGIVFHFRK
jgi:hypothetical protein